MKVISFLNNESRLIARALKKERTAQQRLYEMYSGKMLSVCRMYIKDLQHAEDVMIGGFLKVFTHLDSFRGEGSFEGWIRRIMVREAVSWLRRGRNLEFRDEEFEDQGVN